MMPHYEYKVVPAPTKGQKAKGVKTPEGRFAQSVQSVLNTLGAEGWEYLRAELLPSDERSGLTGSATHWRNVLVFRRPSAADAEMFQPRLLDDPVKHEEPRKVEPETPDSNTGKTPAIADTPAITDVADTPEHAAVDNSAAPKVEAHAPTASAKADIVSVLVGRNKAEPD